MLRFTNASIIKASITNLMRREAYGSYGRYGSVLYHNRQHLPIKNNVNPAAANSCNEHIFSDAST